MLKKLKAIGILLVCLGLSIIVGFKVKLYMDGKKQEQIKANFLALCEAYRERDSWNDEDGNGGKRKLEEEIANYRPLTGETIAIIQIPKIDIDVSVVEGVRNEDIKLNVGHFPQSDMPWTPGGNFCVAGHSSVVYNCLFNDLHKAKEGMKCTVITQFGTYDYTITNVRVVEATDVSILERSEDGKAKITMATCINSGSQRLVVIAERD